MSTYKSKFLQVCEERGFIHQITDAEGLDAVLAEGERTNKPVAAYIGFDCTAPSLHVGSLMQIMILHWLQESGHKPIVLMGGGTTKVGDPSGKDEARKLLDDAGIQANMEGIKQVFAKFLEFDESKQQNAAIMVNNDDWLSGLNYISFLRDYGRHFSVNRMLSMDSVKLRLEREQNLSFLEFNYMILQAYDFVELSKRHGVRLQIGGSDQWGNIVQGTELQNASQEPLYTETYDPQNCPDPNQGHPFFEHLREIVREKTGRVGIKFKGVKLPLKDCKRDLTFNYTEALFGLTTPLLTTASGAKMGKTASGAVWLNEDQLSAYDYWQYWRNTEDADVGRFLRFFTTLPIEKIRELESLEGAGINEAKKVLATEVTALCHGREAAEAAAETARKTFELGQTSEGLPTVAIASAELQAGVPIYALLARAGLAASNSEARKLIRAGSVKLNDAPANDEAFAVTLTALTDGALKLSVGKKKHVLVKPE